VDETSLPASRKCGVVAVFGIGLAPRNILDVVGTDQADFETFSLQHLIEGDPVHSGRFHDNRFNLASLEPLAEEDQVAGKYPEATHGTCIPIFRHCHPWRSAPMSIPAALRCIFCSKARSRLRWLLALFDDFFGISSIQFEVQ
jgi:hypothetical protein